MLKGYILAEQKSFFKVWHTSPIELMSVSSAEFGGIYFHRFIQKTEYILPEENEARRYVLLLFGMGCICRSVHIVCVHCHNELFTPKLYQYVHPKTVPLCGYIHRV